MNNVHSCNDLLRLQSSKLLGSHVVKSVIDRLLHGNLFLKPKEVIELLKVSYGLDITYKIAYRAINLAKEEMHGAGDSYQLLSWYRDAVLESNLGSCFVLETDPETSRFQRLFLSFGGAIHGFQFCISLLFVDGTFCKSKYKGQLLCATGKNGNQGFFPLALVVVDSETRDNWEFCFKHLKSILAPQGRTVTFVSDQQINGLMNSMARRFPDSPHLYCYYHLIQNLHDRFKGPSNKLLRENLEQLFMKVAYSHTVSSYNRKLRNLVAEGKDEINKFLSQLPVEKWCRAFFAGNRYGEMANSAVESFNAWIREERGLPVFDMLEAIRIREMMQNFERRAEA